MSRIFKKFNNNVVKIDYKDNKAKIITQGVNIDVDQKHLEELKDFVYSLFAQDYVEVINNK